jgi:hypothetical protein
MGRKSSAKGNPPAQTPPPAQRSKAPAFVAGLIMLALVAGALTYFTSPAPAEQQTTESTIPDRGPIATDLKPHPQENLPPLQFPAYATSRPPEVVRAAYKFAAEHPEVLSYVPCFCGCERSGHRGNEDCFVKARDVNGDVVQWEEHGMECAVCLDVATRSLQMYTAGKSVEEIRATVDKEFGPLSTTHTPTPEAPHNH